MAMGGTARQTFLAIVKGDASQAVTEFNKLGKAVDKSTGTSTSGLKRLMASGKAISDEFTGYLKTPAGMAAGFSAAGTAAVKAAGQFSDLGKTALEVGRATGLTTEEASRWVAVADDFGMSAESLQTGLGKIGKTLDSPKWAKYGIATKDAGGNLRSVNAIFLDTLDLLNNTQSATDRARIGNDLFGKGFGSLAPLLGKSKTELQGYLAAVSEAQVITNGEAAAGEKWRLAMDDLKDSLTDVVTTLGEVVVAGAPLLELLAKIGKGVSWVVDWTGVTNDSSEAAASLAEQLKLVSGDAMKTSQMFASLGGEMITAQDTGNVLEFGLRDLGYAIAGTNDVAMNLTEQFGILADESPLAARQVYEGLKEIYLAGIHGDLAAQNLSESLGLNVLMLGKMREELPAAALALYDMQQAADDEAQAQRDAAEAAKRHSRAIRDLISARDDLFKKAYTQVEREYKFAEAQTALKSVMDDSTATFDEQFSAVMDVVHGYGELNGATEGSESDIKRQVAALEMVLGTIDSSSPLYKALNDYKNTIEDIPTQVNTQFGLQTPSGAAFKLGFGTAGGLSGVNINPAGMTPGTVNLTVYVTNPVLSGQQIAEELAAYYRRTGATYKLYG